MASTEQNKAVIRKFWDLFMQGDVNAIGEDLIDPQVKVYTADSPEPLNLEGYRALGAMYLRAFPDCKIYFEDQVAEGDMVASRYVFEGTHRGELQGIAPTGRRVHVEGMAFDRIRNGRIVEHYEVADNVGLLVQLGVMQSPAQQ